MGLSLYSLRVCMNHFEPYTVATINVAGTGKGSYFYILFDIASVISQISTSTYLPTICLYEGRPGRNTWSISKQMPLGS